MEKRIVALMLYLFTLFVFTVTGCDLGWKVEGIPQPQPETCETPTENPILPPESESAAISLEDLITEMHEQESRAQKIAVEFHQILGEIENVVICHTYNDFLSELEYYTGELSAIWREWSDTVEQGDITHLESLFNSYRSPVDEFEEVMKEAEALKP